MPQERNLPSPCCVSASAYSVQQQPLPRTPVAAARQEFPIWRGKGAENPPLSLSRNLPQTHQPVWTHHAFCKVRSKQQSCTGGGTEDRKLVSPCPPRASTPRRSCTAPRPLSGAADDQVGRRCALRGNFFTKAERPSPSSELQVTLLQLGVREEKQKHLRSQTSQPGRSSKDFTSVSQAGEHIFRM